MAAGDEGGQEVERELAGGVRAEEWIAARHPPDGAEERPHGHRTHRGQPQERAEMRAGQATYWGLHHRPGHDQGQGQAAEEGVVEVAGGDEDEGKTGQEAAAERRLLERPKAEQQEEGDPFQRNEIQVAVGVGEVVAREREECSAHQAGSVGPGAVERQPEGGQAAHHEREHERRVVRLFQGEQVAKREEEQPVERQGHHLGQEGDPVREVEVVGAQGKVVEVRQCFLHPPDAPEVGEGVHLVAEQMRPRPEDEGEGEREEKRQVEAQGKKGHAQQPHGRRVEAGHTSSLASGVPSRMR